MTSNGDSPSFASDEFSSPKSFIQPLSRDASPKDATASQTVIVLLVEDNPVDVFVVAEVLNKCPFRVELHVATNGEEAISFLQRLETDSDAPRPGLVLLDLNLPRVSGTEVLAHIRQRSQCAQVPVVIMSSSDLPSDLAAGQQLGANAYFHKPPDYTAYMQLGEIILQLVQPAGQKG